MPKSPASMLYGGGARDSSESEEDSSSTGWSDKDDSSSSASSESSSEEADPLPPPASSPKAATSPSSIAKMKDKKQKSDPISPKASPPTEPLSDVEPTKDTKRADVAPIMPPKRASKSADMYKRGDSDDDSSSSSSEESQSDAPHFTDDSSHNDGPAPVGADMISESNESKSPKKRSFMGLFGKKKEESTEPAAEWNSDDAYVPYIGASSVEEPVAPPDTETKELEKPARRIMFGRFRSSKQKDGPTDAKGLGPSDDPNVTVEEIEAAQDEGVEFESAPNAKSSARGSLPDEPTEDTTVSTKRRFWFGKSRTRDTEGDLEEPDIEHGVTSAEDLEPEFDRRVGRSTLNGNGGRCRLILLSVLALILLAGVAFGAAYGGFTLANQNKTSPTPGVAPTPSPVATSGPCKDDDILLDLSIQFDAQPERASIELKDYGSVNSAIWSFPTGSFRSFTQLRRQNYFQICLNPLPSYELSISSLNGTGMTSEFAGTMIYGSWVLSYNQSMVATYSGDCNNTNATFCGAYNSCSFTLMTNSTSGNCSVASIPTTGTKPPGESFPPGTNASSSSAPASQVPTTPGTTTAPATQAPSAIGTTAAPGTTNPSVSVTTVPAQGTSQPTALGSTLPPQATTAPQ